MTPRSLIDLTACRAAFHKNPRGRRLANLIDQFSWVNSAERDLQHSKRALDRLIEIDARPGSQPTHVGDEANAWMISAVIYYCRATDTKSDVRVGLPISKWYTPEQKLLHISVKNLRNKAIAHFGPGQSADRSDWVREKAVLVLQGAEMTLDYPSVRSNYRAPDIQALSNLLDVCKKKVTDLIKSRGKALLEEIDSLSDNQEFLDVLRNNGFDPFAFSVTAESALAIGGGDNGLPRGVRFSQEQLAEVEKGLK